MDAKISISVIYQVKWIGFLVCVPYKFRLIQVDVVGEVTVNNGNVVASAELDYTTEWSWKRNLYTIDLGGFTVWLTLVPVRLRFKMPFDFGIDTLLSAIHCGL